MPMVTSPWSSLIPTNSRSNSLITTLLLSRSLLQVTSTLLFTLVLIAFTSASHFPVFSRGSSRFLYPRLLLVSTQEQKVFLLALLKRLFQRVALCDTATSDNFTSLHRRKSVTCCLYFSIHVSSAIFCDSANRLQIARFLTRRIPISPEKSPSIWTIPASASLQPFSEEKKCLLFPTRQPNSVVCFFCARPLVLSSPWSSLQKEGKR